MIPNPSKKHRLPRVLTAVAIATILILTGTNIATATGSSATKLHPDPDTPATGYASDHDWEDNLCGPDLGNGKGFDKGIGHACQHHDACYAGKNGLEGWSRNQCDVKFMADLKKDCGEVCESTRAFGALLDLAGEQFFEKARKEQASANATRSEQLTGQPFTLEGQAGKCLTTQPTQSSGKYHVKSADCSDAANQQWTYNLKGELKQNGLCLDISNGRTGNEIPVRLHNCNQHLAQRWTISYLNDNATSPLRPRSWDGRCLDTVDGSTKNNAGIQVYKCNTGKGQQWQVK